MKSMHHNGVMVPPEYEGQEFTVKIKGKTHQLTAEQEAVLGDASISVVWQEVIRVI